MAYTDSNTFSITIAPAPTTDLDAAIAALSVGSFVQFKTSSQFAAGFFVEPGGGGGAGNEAGNIGDYAHKGVYDATRKKIFLIGAAYNGRHYWCAYDAAANSGAGSWTRTTIGTEIIHIWDHLAYNPASGHLQYWAHHGLSTMRLVVDTSTFSASVASGPWSAIDDTSMHTFHAGLDRFIAVSRTGVIRQMTPGGSSWSNLTSDGGGERGYSGISAYDSITGTYYYGGGSNLPTRLWKLNSSGVASLVTTSAPSLYQRNSWLMPARNAAGTAMDLLWFSRSAGAMQKSTNGGVSWSSNGTMPAGSYDSANGRMFGIPLVDHTSGYGVVMFVNAEAATAWLYRYS